MNLAMDSRAQDEFERETENARRRAWVANRFVRPWLMDCDEVGARRQG